MCWKWLVYSPPRYRQRSSQQSFEHQFMTAEASQTHQSRADLATAMPFDNPTFEVAPVIFGARHGLTVVAPVDSELVTRLLPPRLASVGSDLILQFNFNPITSPVNATYHNVAVIVPATFDGRDGLYFSRIYEGSAQAAMLSIWGREIWGFPKVAADVDVSRDSRTATATMAAANGCARGSVEIELHDLEPAMQPEAEMSVFCRKMIPRSDGRGYDVDRLVLAPVKNTPEHHTPASIIRCDVSIDIDGKECHIPIDQNAVAFWYDQEPGLVLDLGQDLFDYLAP